MESCYLQPSQCSTRRSGSLLSLKKTSGASAVNIEDKISEFEFEFCLDSDGFIKNKDYKIPNYQVIISIFNVLTRYCQLPSRPLSLPAPETAGELDDEYDDDYDEWDEDTMDVEDIPEDAEFEWCWDEEGRMKIEEVNKV